MNGLFTKIKIFFFRSLVYIFSLAGMLFITASFFMFIASLLNYLKDGYFSYFESLKTIFGFYSNIGWVGLDRILNKYYFECYVAYSFFTTGIIIFIFVFVFDQIADDLEDPYKNLY